MVPSSTFKKFRDCLSPASTLANKPTPQRGRTKASLAPVVRTGNGSGHGFGYDQRFQLITIHHIEVPHRTLFTAILCYSLTVGHFLAQWVQSFCKTAMRRFEPARRLQHFLQVFQRVGHSDRTPFQPLIFVTPGFTPGSPLTFAAMAPKLARLTAVRK